jgi:SAM-dependent methyltransferase
MWGRPIDLQRTSPLMNLSPDELAAIATRTLEHYEQRAEAFWEGTRDHDVSQNVAALLRHIEGVPPFAILDLGCGPGRDLKAFRALGHAPVGLEGSARFAAMAREYSACKIWEQDLLRMDLPSRHFDGVFANATLFHVPTQELAKVLGEIHATLKPRGILLSSNPHGDDSEGWNRGRYSAYLRHQTWHDYLSRAGFAEVEHYYRPEGLPRDQQPWLATVAQAI